MTLQMSGLRQEPTLGSRSKADVAKRNASMKTKRLLALRRGRRCPVIASWHYLHNVGGPQASAGNLRLKSFASTFSMTRR